MSHVDPEQLAGLALDPTDGPAEVREHAETCPECAGLVAAFTGVGAAMVLFGRPTGAIRGPWQTVAVLGLFGSASFAVLYVTLPMLLARGPLRGFFREPGRTRAFCALFLFCAIVTPPFAAASLAEPLHLFNPVQSIYGWADKHDMPERVAFQVTVLGAAALLSLAACDRVLAAREREAHVG